MLWVLAALTMTVGNVVALVQTNIKRMLAYSAIAHAGYLLVAMAAAVPRPARAMLYYLLGYVVTNLGAFASGHRAGAARRIARSDRGLPRTRAARAGAGGGDGDVHAVVDRRSAAGGFVGKFYLFAAALQAGLVWLVVIAVLNSVMSAYYYI